MTGAGDGIRTRDIDLGKVALYQLSYSRLKRNFYFLLTAGKLSNLHRNRRLRNQSAGDKITSGTDTFQPVRWAFIECFPRYME
jgi:hypothetical protein